jgi:hypothetical protein
VKDGAISNEEEGVRFALSYHNSKVALKMRLSWRIVAGVLFAISAALITGCARTPAGASAQSNRQLIVQFSVRGIIDPSKHYFFAIDATGDTSQGPVPVVAPPWGNGWGAERITQYVQIDNVQPGYYGVYQFNPNSNLLSSTYLGRPIAESAIQGGNSVAFSLPLDQITAPDGSAPTQINFNIITTDRIPVDPNDRASKLVDGLGSTGNDYVTINLQSSRIYQNSDAIEPESIGDVSDPDLDISDWQVEVRTQ